MASTIQRGRGQLPMPVTASGGIAGAGLRTEATAAAIGAAGAETFAAGLSSALPRASNLPLQIRKLRCLPVLVNDTTSLDVRRHHAGKSSSTEISVERIS